MCTKGASLCICYAGPDWPAVPSTARIMLDVSTAHDLECMTGADELVSQHAQLQTMPARRPKLPLVEFYCNDGVVIAGWACPSNKALMALVQQGHACQHFKTSTPSATQGHASYSQMAPMYHALGPHGASAL